VEGFRELTRRLDALAPKLSGLVGVASFSGIGPANQVDIRVLSPGRKLGEVLESDDSLRRLGYVGSLSRGAEERRALVHDAGSSPDRLNDIFALALWTSGASAEGSGELLLAADRYGNMPLYYRQQGQHVLFATEAKSILALTGERAALNRQVLGELLWFGFPLAEDTLFNGISKVGPGTAMRFTAQGAAQQRYWRLEFKGPGAQEPKNAEGGPLAQAEQAFRHAVARDCADTSATAIALSGGLDTRVILAEVLSLGLPVAGFTSGVAEGADMELGARLGALLRGKYHRCVISNEYLSRFADWARAAVRLGEGGVLLKDAHLVYCSEWCRDRFKVLVDGGAADIAKRGLLRRAAQSLDPDDDLVAFLMERWGSSQLAELVLEPAEFAAVRDSVRAKLATLLAGLAPGAVGNRLDALFLRSLWPNMIGPQTALQHRYLEGRLPFLDYQFVDAVTGFPLVEREKARFHFAVVRTRAPQLRRFGRTFANHVVPWSDSPLLKYFKPGLSRAACRLGLEGWERPSFPYARWWRNELHGFVRELLGTLEARQVLRQSGMAELASGTLKAAGVAERVADLAASRLGMLELWHQEFVDKDGIG
jgi:asparagine synthetase B (glutamine-hydrolysing)